MDPSASISSSSGCSTSIHTKTCSSSRSRSASPSSSSPSIRSPSRNACARIMAASVPQPPAIASRIVPLPEPLHRFWVSLDELVADVLPTPWGAVVTDARFPDVWDTNYARLDVATEVSVATIEADLLPALLHAGGRVEHVVSFHHEAHGELLAELAAGSSRSARSWCLPERATSTTSRPTRPRGNEATPAPSSRRSPGRTGTPARLDRTC